MRLIKKKKRALMFRIGGLGDLLVALPSISLARRMLPGFSLTLVGRPEYGELLEHCGVLDEVISIEDPRVAAVFGSESRASCGPGTSWLAGFGLAMGWLNRRGEWPAEAWWIEKGMAQAFFTSFESGPAEPMSRTFFDRTQDFLKTSGIKTRLPASDLLFDECARLTVPAGLRRKALDDLRLRELRNGEQRLVVHPGSGGRAKRWPLPNFIEVIRRSASQGVRGVVVTGEAEVGLEEALRELELPAGWVQVARLTAGTLAGLLAESTHYLGNDSGPTHLAAACGASVLALFREDCLPAWRPFGKTRVLSAASVRELPLNDVLAALDDLLAA